VSAPKNRIEWKRKRERSRGEKLREEECKSW
jgi:hypothetical protein